MWNIFSFMEGVLVFNMRCILYNFDFFLVIGLNQSLVYFLLGYFLLNLVTQPLFDFILEVKVF